MSCDSFKPLLMGYLDGEIEGPEAARVESHLASCTECSTELEGFRRLKEVTHDMRVVSPDEKYWEDYWSHIYNRIERKVGEALVSIGTILLLVYGLYELVAAFFFDRHVPTLVRMGVAALLTGLVTLMVSVIRERIFLAKSDKYQRITK